MKRTLFFFLFFSLHLPITLLADAIITPDRILGSWETKHPHRKLHFYIDGTFMVQFSGQSPARGNWVLYKNKKPLFFVLDNNKRRPCPFVSYRNSLLKIDGHEALAGSWEKVDNSIKMNW